MQILKAVERVTESQKELLYYRLLRYFDGKISGRKFAVWGLSFKPETDDMREAPALILIDKLCDAGARVKVYDPVAMPECKRRIGNKVEYAENIYEAVADVDGNGMERVSFAGLENGYPVYEITCDIRRS